jgi:hypothetical protein
MNDREIDSDIERRLRDVVGGPQPAAPESLHRFLRQMPENAAPGRPLAGLQGAFGWVPDLLAPRPVFYRLRLAFGVAMAVLIGLAGGGLVITLRQGPSLPVASGSPVIASPRVTPPRSMSAYATPVAAQLGLMSLACRGIPAGNSTMALPMSAVVTRAGAYLGVTGGAFGGAGGASGLVHSTDGLFWDWSPPSTIDPEAAELTSIATDNLDTIVVTGAAQGLDGTADGRIWVSANDGVSWQTATDVSIFEGIEVRTVVYGSGQFVALGWNDVSPTDSLRQVAEWRSVDGRSWTHVTTPIKGTAALIVPTAAGFLLSGTPLTSGAIDEPPMWHSPDGVTWTRSKASGNTAQLIGPLLSATVTGQSHVYAVDTANDGTNHRLVASADGGLTWSTVKPDTSLPYAGSISDVASINTNDTQYGAVEFLFATLSRGDPNVYVSTDGGVTWKVAEDPNAGGPTGTTLLQLGSGYLAGGNRVLSFGPPGSGLGIWLLGGTSSS